MKVLLWLIYGMELNELGPLSEDALTKNFMSRRILILAHRKRNRDIVRLKRRLSMNTMQLRI